MGRLAGDVKIIGRKVNFIAMSLALQWKDDGAVRHWRPTKEKNKQWS